MNIDEFIDKYRLKVQVHHFFLNWWCYIFARMLQANYWWVIYSNIDHCVLKKDWWFYDIEWFHENTIWFRTQNYIPIDELCEARYKNYENFIVN